jgi:hypothetical protein
MITLLYELRNYSSDPGDWRNEMLGFTIYSISIYKTDKTDFINSNVNTNFLIGQPDDKEETFN